MSEVENPQQVSELYIFDGEKTIFDFDDKYIIPLYQRAYTWGDKQLYQLIEDICDVAGDVNYYIGSLIVARQSGGFEVVDGQQRLTSLFLLLHCLGLIKERGGVNEEDTPESKPALTFACRDKSNYTLSKVQPILRNDFGSFDIDRVELNILSALQTLQELLDPLKFDRVSFLRKLRKVVIYRIEVPKNTDLNRYFEIMNTRGEQLEQHDILKAKLMSYLVDESEKEFFAQVWEACSDMTGYVQMHFKSKNNELREAIFSESWNKLPSNVWEDYRRILKQTEKESIGHTIDVITDRNFKVVDDDGLLNDNVRVRFESIIDFPYFLLHTLKVYVNIYDIKHKDSKLGIVDNLLDDKKLIDSFERVIKCGIEDNNPILKNEKDFVHKFLMCLLRTRFLFDQYIIKREYANDSAEGEWSLKRLEISNKKPYYKNSRFVRYGQWETTNNWNTKTNIMIQAALRVSYVSPRVMHWITKLLCWLSVSNAHNYSSDEVTNLATQAENIAIEAVKTNFFGITDGNTYTLGVNTPHIVFNFLDYLLWQEDRLGNSKDFIFEFRNSVEHWYPQHPSEGTIEVWEDNVDCFGNLCLIQRNINSKFSNMPPEAKKSTFTKMIAKGSLKLRKMCDLTVFSNGLRARDYWKQSACAAHEKEMIEKLKRACNIDQEITKD